jgi:SPP1 family predicted phage head-tail adaptor
MRVGKLRHTGTIENLVKGQDDAGGALESWTEFKKVWCDIKPLNGNEKYVSHEKHSTATHQVIMRYVSGVDTKMRLLSRGRKFDILSALNINEEDKMLQLVVQEDADANN